MALKKIEKDQIWKRLSDGQYFQVEEVGENLISLKNITTNEVIKVGLHFEDNQKVITTKKKKQRNEFTI